MLIKVRLLFLILFLHSTFIGANEFVLSSEVSLDYPNPVLISHTQDSLIFKYDGWMFAHNVVNPKSMYQAIDLTGLEKDYIQALFFPEKINRLPTWLGKLAQDQSTEFSFTNSLNVEEGSNNPKILAGFNKLNGIGHAYIFDVNSTHHIVFNGKKDKFELIVKNVRKR